MSNSGARRVVNPGNARAPSHRFNLDKLRSWRGGLGPAVGGVLAGFQAVLITFLTIVVPAVATYIATSGNPDLAHTAWGDSLRIGTDIWLLGHGGATSLEGAAVTAMPLGIMLLALLAQAGTFRRVIEPSAPAWFTAVITYPVGLLVFGAIFASTTGRAELWRAVLGALLLALLGVSAGWIRHGGLRSWQEMKPAWAVAIPGQVLLSLRGAVLALCALLGAASLVAATWIFQGQSQISDLLVGLGGDWLSIFILGVAQLLVVPNLVLWAFAWISGAGFTVGIDTLWAPDAVISGPLPAFPLLGAVPDPDSFLPGNWVYVVVLAAGVLAAVPVLRRYRNLAWYWSLSCAGIIAAGAGLGTLLLAALASGSIGPGRMSQIGPHAGLVALHILVPVLIASGLTLFIGGKHARDAWNAVRPSSREGGQTGSKPDSNSGYLSASPQKPPHTSPALKR